MRAILAPVVAIIALVWLACPSAFAERRVAFVVGNSDYQSVGALRNPANDAADVSALLTGLGFEVTTALDLTGDEFTDRIEAFDNTAAGADVALFYYSGHGIQVDGVNYLLPVDASAETELKLKRQAIDLTDIVHRMEAGADVNLVFLDACRDNPLVETLQQQLKARGRSAAVQRGLARVEAGSPNTMIVFAAAAGRTASDGDGRNSPFTSAFLDNAATPGVEIEVLMKRITAAVADVTRNGQLPERLSKLTVEFYFAPAGQAPRSEAAAPRPAEPSPSLGAETAFWQGIAGSKERSDFDAYLRGVEEGAFSGLFADLARQRLAALTAEPAPSPSAAQGAGLSAGPQQVDTEGYNGPIFVRGNFKRINANVWEERNDQLHGLVLTFRLISETRDEITLYDDSRAIWIKLDLAHRQVFLVIGGEKPAWAPFYSIIAVR